jgi:UDP-glucose 4-epimerase
MYGLRYVMFRYFNVYGPRMDTQGKYTEVLIRWMERIEAGLPPVIFGDGSQTMDIVYIADVARATVLGLVSDASDEVFNIASGVETSLKELAEALIKSMKADLSLEYGAERTVNPVPRRLADISKAKSRLGFEAQVGLEEGLARLVEWWRAEKKKAG